MTAIPLIGSNIYVASAIAGVGVEELNNKLREAEYEYKKNSDRQWALGELGYDEEWWEPTQEKIKKIESELPNDMGHKEKTIKMYGWIKPNNSRIYTIPMEMDHEYGHAHAIALIMTNPDLYLKIINWD